MKMFNIIRSENENYNMTPLHKHQNGYDEQY